VVLLRSCDGPVELPAEGLSAWEVEAFWLVDRAALISCAEAKVAVQEYYSNRDRALSGR